MSSQIRDLYIAKGALVVIKCVNSISPTLNFNDNNETRADRDKGTSDSHNLWGKLKRVVLEHENLGILKLFEKDRFVVVLVNSNTQLQHTIDNILGYYYDLDEAPKSLF